MRASPGGVAVILSDDPWEWPDMVGDELIVLSEMGSGPDAPLSKYVAVRECLALKAEIDAGSGFAVLAAVHQCATRRLVMPDWLAMAFIRRYRAVLNLQALSWDDAASFGKPYPKGTNKSARRKARMLRFAVLNSVNQIISSEPQTAVNKALFARVGKPLGIGGTLASELYYQAKGAFESGAKKPGQIVHRIR